MADPPPLLIEALPDLAEEMERDLRSEGEPELADQVKSLRMTESCGCGDEFCSSFYAGPRPNGAYGPGHDNVVTEGGLILDVVDSQIMFVEILYRDELRPRVLAVFGEEAG